MNRVALPPGNLLFIFPRRRPDDDSIFFQKVIGSTAADPGGKKYLMKCQIIPVAQNCVLCSIVRSGNRIFKHKTVLIGIFIRPPSTVAHFIIGYPNVFILIYFKGADHRWASCFRGFFFSRCAGRKKEK